MRDHIKEDLSPFVFLSVFYTAIFLGICLMTLNAFAGTDAAPVDFQKTALPILKNSCFSCHVPNAAVPYSGADPVLGQKIKKEIADALEDFTMADQFPFPAGEPADKQLKQLEKELRKGFMPPDDQTKLGLGASLSDKDRKILLEWVAQQKTVQK